MGPHVIEGTWEEIKTHEAELVGRYVRVTVEPVPQQYSKVRMPVQKSASVVEPKVLRGFGAFKDVLPSSEEYMREKREDIELEERNI